MSKSVKVFTPEGVLVVEWPERRLITDSETLEPVAYDPLQDCVPTARLNGSLISIGKAQEILDRMDDE